MAYTKTLTSGQSFTYTNAQGSTVTYNYSGATEGESTGICSAHTEGVDVGLASCAGHRSTCTGNKTGFSDGSLAAGWSIRDYHVNQLRTAISEELTSRNTHKDFSYTTSVPGSNVSAGSAIDNAHFSNVNSALNRMGGNTGIPGDGTAVAASVVTSLRNRIRALEGDCICNSDCACNSVCTCNTDCRCNYSDITLKRDIEPLNLGLDYLSNIDTYKFQYLWDKEAKHYGVMAQELNDDVLVSEDKNGKLMVSYIELVPILINAVKELSEKLNNGK